MAGLFSRLKKRNLVFREISQMKWKPEFLENETGRSMFTQIVPLENSRMS